ncbi:MFS transporter, DHA2 family, multidrug resistance protein [Devosia lucknowensis]|uniref:MFS transporter, DHA2 family, multidrug resistance protein n=1 Tax=Devosia lucknowensis TaxID=1096929 RepID=A0A1Y6GCN3_9HYPH|nr:MFS transporter [Devosia lucknowensis]SMQ85829.1 MFS transporter, DHA2 family, multidrug resistance protein [Devosia lucknowensis]
MSAHRNRWLVLIAVMLAFTPIVIDMTILHIAVPSLTMALNASGTEILWIIDIYPLIMAGLLVPMGTLADRIGNRRMLLTGLAVFLVASVIAASAPSATTLIGARILLAVGASMVIPNVLALIRLSFENPRERGIALGFWGTVGAAGSAFGPLVGGFLLEHFWWGSVFLINVPVMLLVWPFAFAVLPRTKPAETGPWSIGQALLLIAGLIATVYAAKSGFKPGASLPLTMAALVAGLALIVIFVRKQLHAHQPMLDIALFSRPAITVGVIMALAVTGALAGAELTIAQELQFVVGRTPLEAGLFMMPLVIASAIGGPLAGYAVSLVGLRIVASSALLVAAASLAGLGLSNFHEPGVGVVAMMAALGLALSIGLTASSIAIMSSAPADKAGAAGSLEGTGYELGAGLGITFFGVLLSASYGGALRVPADLAAEVPDAASHSIGETMLAARDLGAAGDSLADAARHAFTAAHSTVLLSAAALIAVMAVAVLVALRHYRDAEAVAAH